MFFIFNQKKSKAKTAVTNKIKNEAKEMINIGKWSESEKESFNAAVLSQGNSIKDIAK